MTALHKMPTLGVFAADIEKYGIGFTCFVKPHIGANQCEVFFCVGGTVRDICFPPGEVFLSYSGHDQDALLRPLKHRYRNQQGNITCEIFLPK